MCSLLYLMSISYGSYIMLYVYSCGRCSGWGCTREYGVTHAAGYSMLYRTFPKQYVKTNATFNRMVFAVVDVVLNTLR